MMSLKVLVIIPVSIAGRLIVSTIIDGLMQNSLFSVDVVKYDELYDTNIKQVVADSDYDLIIGYDFSPLKIKIDYSLCSKCASYFADNINSLTSGPEWEKYYQYLYRDDVFTFFWDREMMSQYDFKNLYYQPQFTNFDVYCDMGLEKEFDVMFAGRLDTDLRLNLFVNLMLKLPELNFAWYAIDRHYKDALKRTPHKGLIEKAYKGFIDNEKDMSVATNKSKVVVTMNSQGISSLNYRTVQTVACNTLVVSDKRAELDLYDGVLPFYENEDDLVNKIRYYLSHPVEYSHVTQKCWEIGRKNHHSKENVEFILNKVFS